MCLYKVIFLVNRVMVSLKMDQMHYYLDDRILKFDTDVTDDIHGLKK